MCQSLAEGGRRCRPSVSYNQSVDYAVKLVNKVQANTLQDLTKTSTGQKICNSLADTKYVLTMKQQQRDVLKICNTHIPSFAHDLLKGRKQLIDRSEGERFDGNTALKNIEEYNKNHHVADRIDPEKYANRSIDVSKLTRKEQRELLKAGILQKTGNMTYSLKNAAAFADIKDEPKADAADSADFATSKDIAESQPNLFPIYSECQKKKNRYKADDKPYGETLKLYDEAMKAHKDWEAKNPGCIPPIDKNGVSSYPSHKWDAYGDAMVVADRNAKDVIDNQKKEEEKLATALFGKFASDPNNPASQTVAFIPHEKKVRKPVGTENAGNGKTRNTYERMAVDYDDKGEPLFSTPRVEKYARKLQADRDTETVQVLEKYGVHQDHIQVIKDILDRPGAKFDSHRAPETNINAMLATSAHIRDKVENLRDIHGVPAFGTSVEREKILSEITAGESAVKALIRDTANSKLTVTLGDKVKTPLDDFHFREVISKMEFAQGKEAIKVSDSLLKGQAQKLIDDNPGKVDTLLEDSKISVSGTTYIKS